MIVYIYIYIQNMKDYNEYHMPRKASDAPGHKTVVVVVVVVVVLLLLLCRCQLHAMWFNQKRCLVASLDLNRP